MRKQKLKIINTLLAIIMILSTLITTVQAADTNLNLDKTTGSLTITKYETGKKDGDGEYLPLKDVKFEIYRIDDDSEDTTIPSKYTDETYDPDVEGDTTYYKADATTGDDGIVKFENLELGRYLVVEAEAPENVVSKIASFIVDIPMTSADGTGLIYDVEVSPKNNTVYGGFVLHKEDGNGNALGGVTFLLQKYNETTSAWEDYKTGLITAQEGALAEDGITELEEGTITLTGLPAGQFRFIETATIADYILDNATPYTFTVSLEADGTTKVDPETITVQNDKPEVTKEITSTLTSGSVNIGDTVSFKITSEVPSTIARLSAYTVEETIAEGLTYDESSLVINKVDGEGNAVALAAEDYTATYDETTRKLTITFTNANLEGSEKLEITYDTEMNENADATTTGNTNSTKLTYSNIVNKDYNDADNTLATSEYSTSSTVKTGGFWAEKRALTTTGTLLQGAKFKIATSEANAKSGEYLDQPNSTEDIILTSDADGKIEYKGLAYGTYWLVEVEAPTYTEGEGENQQTKHYNLLRKPVEILVGENTYTSATTGAVIVNKKGFELPDTGGMGTIAITVVGITLIILGVSVYKKGNKEEK